MAAFIDHVPETPFELPATNKKSRTSKRTTAKKGAKQAQPQAPAADEPVQLQEEQVQIKDMKQEVLLQCANCAGLRVIRFHPQDPSSFYGKQGGKPIVRLADGKQVLIRERLPNAQLVGKHFLHAVTQCACAAHASREAHAASAADLARCCSMPQPATGCAEAAVVQLHWDPSTHAYEMH